MSDRNHTTEPATKSGGGTWVPEIGMRLADRVASALMRRLSGVPGAVWSGWDASVHLLASRSGGDLYEEKEKEEWKEDNRKPARLIFVKAEVEGWRLERIAAGMSASSKKFSISKKLKMVEHDYWVRDHLIHGYKYSKEESYSIMLVTE